MVFILTGSRNIDQNIDPIESTHCELDSYVSEEEVIS